MIKWAFRIIFTSGLWHYGRTGQLGKGAAQILAIGFALVGMVILSILEAFGIE